MPLLLLPLLAPAADRVCPGQRAAAAQGRRARGPRALAGAPHSLRCGVRAALDRRLRLPARGLTRVLARASAPLALGAVVHDRRRDGARVLLRARSTPTRASCRRSSTCTCRWRSWRWAASWPAGCSRSSTCAAATAPGTCAPTWRSTCRSSSASACWPPARSGPRRRGGTGGSGTSRCSSRSWSCSSSTACYYPLRFSIEDPERQSRYSSVFAITAGAFVPLNFVAVRLAEAYTHPRVLSQTGGDLPGEMRLTFLVCAARDDAAVRDALEARADRQERLDAPARS